MEQEGIDFKKHKFIRDISNPYQCDFFVEPNLIIEIDGEYWHSLPENKRKDEIRRKELIERGYRLLIIPSFEIMNKSYKINEENIKKYLEVINDGRKIHIFNE